MRPFSAARFARRATVEIALGHDQPARAGRTRPPRGKPPLTDPLLGGRRPSRQIPRGRRCSRLPSPPRPTRTLPSPTSGDRWLSEFATDRQWAAEQCRSCAVIRQCKAAADERDERWGVWGGQDRARAGQPGRPKEADTRAPSRGAFPLGGAPRDPQASGISPHTVLRGPMPLPKPCLGSPLTPRDDRGRSSRDVWAPVFMGAHPRLTPAVKPHTHGAFGTHPH
jgi:hypothetical protein